MSTEQLELRLSAIEKTLADIQKHLATQVEPKKGILSVVGSMADQPGFDEVVAYGRYFRVTGKMPPDDWKPGDPIPEPEYDE